MSAKRKPRVLIVDDKPDDAAKTIAQNLAKSELSVSVEHPDDVDPSQLAAVDVLLVDYDLNAWDQAGVSTANFCSSGWSLAAVLRDHIRLLDKRKTVSVTALLTSQIDAATVPFRSAGREHISADLNGIEWVFDKLNPDLGVSISSLAHATTCVKRNWELSDIYKALGAGASELAKRDDIIRCRPPLAENLLWQDGLGFVRWMLHRVLPYPTYLVDEHYIATQLGVSEPDAKRLLASKGSLGKKLNSERYKGVLSEFAGPRWWRLGVDAALWEITDGQPSNSLVLRNLVKKEIGKLKHPLAETALHLVTCYSERICPLPLPADVSDAQRIWPDDWPPFASQPWALKDDVEKSPILQRIAAPLGDA